MKKPGMVVIATLLVVSARAQNTFPSTGNVGIGTTSPLGAKPAEGKLCTQTPFVTCDERGKAAASNQGRRHKVTPPRRGRN